MASQSEARNILLGVFREGFEGLRAGRNIPVAYDNQTLQGSGNRLWVNVAIQQTGSEQRTLGKVGNRRFRREGVLSATVRGKPGTGMQDLLTLAEGIRRIFEGKQFGAINPVGGVLVQEEGRDVAGFAVVVTFPFWYEERG